MPRLSREERLERHRANQVWHFQKRIRQRFKRGISAVEYADIIRRIREDKPGVVFLAMRGGASAWRVRWRRLTMVVLYDHRTERLVTAFRYRPSRWR